MHRSHAHRKSSHAKRSAAASSGIYATSPVATAVSTNRTFVPTAIGSVTMPLPPPIVPSDDALTKSWKGTVALEMIKNTDPSKVSEMDKLHTVGHILGCQTQIRAETTKWVHHLDNIWQDPSLANNSFTVLGFCNTAGVPLPHAHVPGNPSILKPIDTVTPRPVADRRPPDVAYAHIRCSYVFSAVASTYTQPFDRFDFDFHVVLPQETRNALNGNNVPTPVTTYWGVDDLSTLTRNEFQTQILSSPPFQHLPFSITPAAPPATRAISDDGKCYVDAKNVILRVMLSHNEQVFLSFVVPRLTSEPYDQVSTIFQTTTDSSGNSSTIPFSDYIGRIMAAAQPWSSSLTQPTDLHGVAFRNADSQIKSQLQLDKYPHHQTSQSLDTDHQMQLMNQLLAAGDRAERSIQQQDLNMTRFLERTGTVLGSGSSHFTGASLLSSQAERTLQQYSGSGHKNGTCFHPDCRSTKHLFGTDCPFFDTPGAKEKAAGVKKKFYEAKRKSRQQSKNKKSYTKMSESERSAFAKGLSADNVREIQALRAAGASNPNGTAEEITSGAESDSDVFTATSVNIFFNPNTNAGPLPVTIDPSLPCFSLRLGKSNDTPKTSVVVRTLVDTGAALSAGNLAFWLRILQEFPNIVSNIFVARGDNYTPIRLGGIVKQDEQTVTTDLPVAFELVTPFFVGDPSKPKRVKIRIACGRNVSANIILGIPFLKPLGGVIDFNDNCLELSKVLNEKDRMHPLQFDSQQLCIPSADRVRASSNVKKENFRHILDELANLHITYVASAVPSPNQPLPSALRNPTSANTGASTGPTNFQPAGTAASSGPNPFVSPASQFIDDDDSAAFEIVGAESAASSLLKLSTGDLSSVDVSYYTPRASLAISAVAPRASTPSFAHPISQQASTPSFSADTPADQSEDPSTAQVPIRPVPKFKSSKKRRRPSHPHPAFDDHGFTDSISEWNTLPHDPEGCLIRKRKHPVPSFEKHPIFHVDFDESLHGDMIRSDLDLSHLPTNEKDALIALIKEFWCVFNPRGRMVPVKDYTCSIDTGDHPGICAKNPTYGPLEKPLIDKAIAGLLELDQIIPTHDGPWLSKGLLAPKPHQEAVTDIDSFVWRFCVSYVALNSITKLIRMPIPRCDDAVNNHLGNGKYKWLLDAPCGFHQIKVDEASRPKLAFAGTKGDKYTYTVMPFGPVNGPAIFIIFIHDMNIGWQELARSRGIVIGPECDTTIIVDDVFSWAPIFQTAINYLRCQLEVCRLQRLSLNLKKCHFFAPRTEYVGTDVCIEGNRPAQSKHQLLNAWPAFRTARDVASFVGFIAFYSKYIPQFEQRILNLRALLRNNPNMETNIEALLQPIHASERDDMINAILSDPCLQRYRADFRTYLSTDFCKRGFGYACLQPDDTHQQSIDSMRREMAGGPCEFLNDEFKLRLRPTSFGSRITRGMEPNLHSYIGEIIAGLWAIKHNAIRCFGQRFTWITDCYAVKFILTYEGSNPVVNRLKMQLLLWNMDIVHRNNKWLVDADFFSRCGEALCYDPLWRDYVGRTGDLLRRHTPATGPMLPENMPGYRRPRITPSATVPEPPINHGTLLSGILLGETFPQPFDEETFSVSMDGSSDLLHECQNNELMIRSIHHCAVAFSALDVPPTTVHLPQFHNHHLPVIAHSLVTFKWALYGFNSGHFFHISRAHAIPFEVVLAADSTAQGRALLKSIGGCDNVLNGAKELHSYVASSKASSPVNGYMIHSRHISSRRNVIIFWSTHLKIIEQLASKRHLSHVVIQIHPSTDTNIVKKFLLQLQKLGSGWHVTQIDAYCPNFGDSVASSITFAVAINKSTSSNVSAHTFAHPPTVTPKPLSAFVHEPFNDMQYCVSFGKDNPAFKLQPISASTPKQAATRIHKHAAIRLYDLHRPSDTKDISAGAGVYSLDNLCPPLEQRNSNLFNKSFGVEITTQAQSMVRKISNFEVASCFGIPQGPCLEALAHESNFHCLDGGIPYRTARWLLFPIYRHLLDIQAANVDVMDQSRLTAAAAVSHAPNFLSGAVGRPMPSNKDWITAYESDPNCKLLLAMLRNPSLIIQEHVNMLHHIYRQPIRSSLITSEDGILYIHERLYQHESPAIKLRIVPAKLRNVIFTAFHGNPIGGHFNAARTFSRLRLRFFWPEMYKYCKRMCDACPGCRLGNLTTSRRRELIYSFPMDAPMLVLHIDGYQAGRIEGFDGSQYYLIVACGMTAFTICEPLSEANAKSFAKALMKILCQNGFCHTVVIDKDSKFCAEFAAMCELLNLHSHVASGGNHNPILSERVIRYLNKALSIMTNERSSTRVSEECILLALYAWNSCPIDGTDFSRSLVVKGREYRFPIDFNEGKHLELISTPSSVSSYVKEQAELIQSSRAIAKALIEERRSYHREYINSNIPDPRTYRQGDRVFARRAVQSSSQRGRVGKLMHPFTGPWQVLKRLHGASYEIRHLATGRTDKKHASDLSPFPPELIPLIPLDGADSSYGQINKKLDDHPYQAAGISGFRQSPNPFSLLHGDVVTDPDLHMPTVAEMNADMFPWLDNEEEARVDAAQEKMCKAELFLSPKQPSTTSTSPSPAVPTASALHIQIIRSTSKLFFISCPVTGCPSTSEWHLVRVNLEATHFHNPECGVNGKYLVDFYIPHPSDSYYNALNMRFWLEYHKTSSYVTTADRHTCHLIRPDANSEDYASRNSLTPFRQWATLTHSSTFIHGPFDFAIVNSRQSRDRISQSDWDELFKYRSHFSNQIPSFDLPTYSVHVEQFHTTYSSENLTRRHAACRQLSSGETIFFSPHST